ncbi:hypothetical protein JW935_25055 [candidate division KSB1 bacterium]|nr:hypothetical protein [candidate division KSB1 bacterium]
MFFRVIVRFLFYGLFAYWIFKFIARMSKPSEPRVQVRGKPNADPLDLSDNDVEDVEYRDVKD